MDTLPPPEDAQSFLADPRTRLDIERLLARDAFRGGFVLVGAEGQGKATLAFMLAATLLSGGKTLGEVASHVRSVIAAGAHPDVTVLRRQMNDRTGKLRSEIDVGTARVVNTRLSQTSTTGRSVVIVDLADELNRNAANSLLKILEEPPEGACLLLLSRSPSRLLPTLVSRCRKIALRPVEEAALTGWLTEAHGIDAEDAATFARTANGAPGKALAAALGEGREASSLAQDYMKAIFGRADLFTASRGFGGKGRELVAEKAWDIILTRLRQGLAEPGIPLAERGRRLEALDRVQEHLGMARTADPAQTAFTGGLKIREALLEGKADHAGR
jgi:DNA polymerase-3 subunit delta'